MTTQTRQSCLNLSARTPSLLSATMKSVTIGALLSGVALFGPSALAQVAGTSTPVPDSTRQASQTLAPTSAPSSAQGLIARATELMKSNQPVRAQSVVDAMLSGDAGAAMSDRERVEGLSLMAKISARIKSTDPIEVSLQKAELAAEQGDVRTTEAQAALAVKSSRATAEQLVRGKALAAKAESMRQEMAAKVPVTLSTAVADYNAGRFAEAKAGLVSVRRSGVKLTLTQAQDLDEYQSKIIDLEKVRGGSFNAIANAGVVAEPAPAAETALAPIEAVPVEMVPAAVAAVVSESAAVQPPAEEKPAEVAPAPMESQPAVQPATDQPATDQPATDQPPTDQLDSARRFTAQQLLAEADAAMRDSRYNEAMTKYSRLNSDFREYLSPEESNRVANKLNEARIQLGNIPTGNVLGDAIESNDIIKQQALAEYQNQQNQARKALDSGDTNRARDLALSSRLTMNANRNVFNEVEFETYQKQVDALLADVDTSARTAAERAAIDRSQANRTLRQQEDVANARKAENRIREAYGRIRELQLQMDYEAALQVVNEQILFLDPTNPAGLILKDVLTDSIIFQRYNQIQGEKTLNSALQRLDNQKAMVPPRGIIDYPKDWPAISGRRSDQLAFNDSEENRRVRGVLAERPETVDFQDVTLASALDFIRGVTKVNLDPDWNSLESIGVRPTDTVSLSLTNVPMQTILNKVLSKVSHDPRTKAGWTVEDGVLTIASEDVIRQKTVTVFYDIKDLLVQVPNYTNVPSFDLTSVLMTAQSQAHGSSPFSGSEIGRGGDNADVFKGPKRGSGEEVSRAIVDVIQRTIDPTGWSDLGGATGSITTMNGNLIIKNTPANHQAISGLLSKLREVRAMQINVEARFMLVAQDFFEKIGFDLDVYFNANNNQVRAAQRTDPTVQTSDFFNFSGTRPGLQRNVTGAAGAGAAGLTQGVVNPRAWSPIGAAQNSSDLTSTLLTSQVGSSTVAGQALGAAPALGIAGQFLDDVQVDFLIQATQADRRSIRLNAPRLTFTNGQTSNIFVATQTAFISALTPVVGTSAVGFDPTLSTVSEGVRLLVEGTVTSDRRYVTMNIDTSVSNIDGIAQAPITAIAGGQLQQSGQVSAFIQIPTVTVTSVSTTVTVPDQGTILIGGQRLVNEYEVETGVPVLSKIPILNRFFANTAKAKDEQTLLILIKPTILIQSEQEDQNFPGLLDSLKTPLGN